jgi:DnaK suppressor protein
MAKINFDKIKNILLSQKEAIEKSSTEKLPVKDHEDSSFADANDRATRDTDLNNDMTVKSIKNKQYIEILEALKRIEEGTFGICEDCDCEISTKRLEAYPTSRLCIVCKEESEKAAKAKDLIANTKAEE